MRYVWLLFGWMVWTGCSQKNIEMPEEGRFSLQLATAEASRFEDYIHSLNVYAFRKTAEETFVYAATLAELEAADIAALADGSERGNSKILPIDLAVGTYAVYAVGNAAGFLRGSLTEDLTRPEDLFIYGPENGEDSIYFLGHTVAQMVTEFMSPVSIELNRAVSKLVLVLYGVPGQVKTVDMTLGNLAQGINLAGGLTPESKTITRSYPVKPLNGAEKDTLSGAVVTLPSLGKGATMRLSFYAEDGEEVSKEMPLQTLLPDKYVRVSGHIDDKPGALLSFEVKFRLIMYDYWLDRDLPNFVLESKE